MIKGLDKDVVKSELMDSDVWFILDSRDTSNYILSPDDVREWVLWLFLKREDAEHFAYLAMKLAPAYNGVEVLTEKDLVKNILKEVDHRQDWEVLSPNEAREFFKLYEELMAKYYGIENGE
jgi:hypothetical protein